MRRGLSTTLCDPCRAKPARAKPERAPTPAYKLTRPVARHGVTRPSTDVAKGNHRDRKLLDLAHGLHECTNCGAHAAHGCEPAHANSGMTESKGLGIKANDGEHAALDARCHRWLDGSGGTGLDPSGRYPFTKEGRREMWLGAYFKTQAEYWRRGWIKCAS